MPSIFDMLLGASPNVQQVDQSDPTGAYLGNMIDPNTAAQFQSAMNQQKMLGLSMGLLSGSAPQLGKPVSFGGALAQGLAGMQQSQNSLVPQALQAAQTSNQIAEGGFNKLKALQLGYQISNMPAAFQSMDNLNKMMKGGAAPGGAPEGGASGAGPQSDSGLTVGAPQKLTSGNLDLNDPAGLVKRFESGGDYNVGFGKVDLSGAKLDQYGFPIWDGKEGPAGISHAAGAYQFEPKTWRQYASKLGIHDFSQESQDKVFAAAYADQGFAPWAPYNSNIASALRNGAGRGPLFGGNATQQQPQADNQQPQGESAPQGGSAPQAAAGPLPPGQFATGAAPFTKTNSVGEQYHWNGEGWELVGKQAPANVAGGTSGAGDAVNGVDKTSGPVTAPMMGPLASAQPPVQVASNGPIRPGILAGSSQIARPPVGIPPGVLGGGAPPQAPQMPVAPPQQRPPVQMAQVNQAGQANPYPNAGTVPSNITPPGGGYNGISPQQIQTARDVITRYNAAGMGQMVPDYIKNLATMDINAAAEAAKAWAGVGPDIYKQNNIPQNIRQGEGIRLGPNIVNSMPQLEAGQNPQGQKTLTPINPLTGQPANIPGVGFLPQLGGAGSPAGAGNAPAGGRPTLGGPAPQTGGPTPLTPGALGIQIPTVPEGVTGPGYTESRNIPVQPPTQPGQIGRPGTTMPALKDIPGISVSDNAKADEIVAKSKDTTTKLAASVPEIQRGIETQLGLANVLSRYQSGAFGTNIAEFKAALKAAIPSMDVSKINNPADAEKLLHDNTNATLTILKATGLQRWAQSEFQAIGKANQNPNLQPGANFHITAENVAPMLQAEAFVRDYTQAKAQSNKNALDPDAYAEAWYSANPVSKYLDWAKGSLPIAKGMTPKEIQEESPHFSSKQDFDNAGFLPGMRFVGPSGLKVVQ